MRIRKQYDDLKTVGPQWVGSINWMMVVGVRAATCPWWPLLLFTFLLFTFYFLFFTFYFYFQYKLDDGGRC